jgi:hypothetical protein
MPAEALLNLIVLCTVKCIKPTTEIWEQLLYFRGQGGVIPATDGGSSVGVTHIRSLPTPTVPIYFNEYEHHKSFSSFY